MRARGANFDVALLGAPCIGQRGAELNEAAVTIARRLQASEARAARWVGSDALRELTSEKVARRVARRGA